MAAGGEGFVVWLTGLPSSGKSVLASELKKQLEAQGVSAQILDSDELRKRLTPRPRYTDRERDWFYGMVVLLAELLTGNGVNVLVAATAPRRAYRDEARRRIRRFAEVYVDCPQDVCRARDPKGLWRRAAEGEITTLPGAGVLYEAPASPEVRVETATLSVPASVRRILDHLTATGFWQARDATKRSASS
jgi:adenylylsulfate kinase